MVGVDAVDAHLEAVQPREVDSSGPGGRPGTSRGRPLTTATRDEAPGQTVEQLDRTGRRGRRCRVVDDRRQRAVEVEEQRGATTGRGPDRAPELVGVTGRDATGGSWPPDGLCHTPPWPAAAPHPVASSAVLPRSRRRAEHSPPAEPDTRPIRFDPRVGDTYRVRSDIETRVDAPSPTRRPRNGAGSDSTPPRRWWPSDRRRGRGRGDRRPRRRRSRGATRSGSTRPGGCRPSTSSRACPPRRSVSTWPPISRPTCPARPPGPLEPGHDLDHRPHASGRGDHGLRRHRQRAGSTRSASRTASRWCVDSVDLTVPLRSSVDDRRRPGDGQRRADQRVDDHLRPRRRRGPPGSHRDHGRLDVIVEPPAGVDAPPVPGRIRYSDQDRHPTASAASESDPAGQPGGGEVGSDDDEDVGQLRLGDRRRCGQRGHRGRRGTDGLGQRLGLGLVARREVDDGGRHGCRRWWGCRRRSRGPRWHLVMAPAAPLTSEPLATSTLTSAGARGGAVVVVEVRRGRRPESSVAGGVVGRRRRRSGPCWSSSSRSRATPMRTATDDEDGPLRHRSLRSAVAGGPRAGGAGVLRMGRSWLAPLPLGADVAGSATIGPGPTQSTDEQRIEPLGLRPVDEPQRVAIVGGGRHQQLHAGWRRPWRRGAATIPARNRGPRGPSR